MDFIYWIVVIILGLVLNFAYVCLCYISAPRFFEKVNKFLDNIEKRREEKDEW